MNLQNPHRQQPPRRRSTTETAARRAAPARWARRLSPLLVGGLLVALPATAAAAPERVYEMISPVAKGGSDVSYGYAAAADGNAVQYDSFAALGGADHAVFSNPYVARRGPNGWTTTPMQAAVPTDNPTLLDAPLVIGWSADLRASFSAGYSPFDLRDENWSQDIARVRDGVSTWVTPSLTLPDMNFSDSDVVGSNADGGIFVVQASKQMVAGVPGTATELYRSGPDGVELASRLPNGTPSGGARLGNGRGLKNDSRAISADGRTLFFTTTSGVSQLYVRRDGVTTLVSADADGNPGTASSTYLAAADDGSAVLFSSTSRLTPGAPAGGGLYRYDVAANELQLMIGGAIDGVMQTSDDLSVAYVVSGAELEPGAGSPGEPKIFRVTDGAARLVARIQNTDAAGWSWGEGSNVGGASSDGGRLVFQTIEPLAGANTPPGRRQVYRYDAESDALACISCRPNGTLTEQIATAVALDEVGSLYQGLNASRVISDDGRLAVFMTDNALLPEDRNDLKDVYGYDDDGLHLISAGLPGGRSEGIDISADGRNVFFVTNSSLSPDDIDNGYRDVYTARIGGGFPAPADPPCTAASCDRPDAPATTFSPVIGSTGVFGQPVEQAEVTTFRVGAISAASRRSWARTGRTTLKVRVSTAAKITVTAKGGKKTVATTSTTRQSAGTATLRLKLSKSAAAQLKRTGRLKMTVTVSVSGVAKASKATVILKTAKKTKKAGR